MISNLYNSLLITYDVVVKIEYTNADKSNLDIPHPDVGDLIFLLRCVLENNYFEFDGKYYEQTIGCSMGAIPSPVI